MKRYIVIILIALHLISANLYATKTFVPEHSFIHQHSHSHNSSNHLHKHSHSQTNSSVLDYFVDLYDMNRLSIVYSKENYIEAAYYISDPTLKSIFRPPIV